MRASPRGASSEGPVGERVGASRRTVHGEEDRLHEQQAVEGMRRVELVQHEGRRAHGVAATIQLRNKGEAGQDEGWITRD